MTLTDKIKSLGSIEGAQYRRPSAEKLQLMQILLQGSDTAKDYLHVSRNLTDDTIKHFGLGYDQEKNAIAIPVYKRGELVNIKYRIIDPGDGPKYIGERGAETWLYNEDGIQEGMKKGGVLITEGEFDCMSAWQAGFKNVVSPASGKDSYGVWLELIDNIPKVYIAYDNDKPGRETAIKLAERVGYDKSSEILYPFGIKDANDYFKKHDAADYRELIKGARPFYKHQFKGIGDVIADMRADTSDKLKLRCLPEVKMGADWVVVISGKSNVGKTSYAMNIAKELMEQNIPTLILPFERGPQVVGARYLQVRYSLSEGDMQALEDEQWDKITEESATVPLYFSMPSREETFDIIKRSKRIFDTRVVIIDHLDLMVRSNAKGSYERDLSETIQNLKRVAEESKVVVLVVHHIRKIDSPGAKRARKPSMEDLKGSSSLYQDPECVVMLTSDKENTMNVSVVKNKGKMVQQTYSFNMETGVLGEMSQDYVDANKEADDAFDGV